jgi:hypothetical protein
MRIKKTKYNQRRKNNPKEMEICELCIKKLKILNEAH